MSKISDNEELNKIFHKEYDAFVKSTTCNRHRYINYFTNHTGADDERTAEATMIVNGRQVLGISVRALYYQEFFPETIAYLAKSTDERIAKLNDL